MMAKTTPAQRTVRLILASAALVLPTLSLVPFGGLYLWEKGYLLAWALFAFVLTSAVFLLNLWLARTPPASISQPLDATPVGDAAIPDPSWSPAERRAWSDVTALAARVDIERLESPQSFIGLAAETIEVVARRLHPDKHDSVWQFTVPEAMTITEQVSRRLNSFAYTHVPFGDRLTLAQIRAIYGWRGAMDYAEKAYDVWRLVRMINPATALTHEARERLSRALVTWGREHITRRIAEAYIEEVGRAAIDLYGGRLRSGAAPSAEETEHAEPQLTPPPRSRFAAGRQAVSAAARGARSLFRSRKR